ncbi:MAG TPA: retropepsin-like aspartic protease, partial [Salinimicrobium sp.]|nr:retropepsin-like aspartic protease [Salinimicrobium sp.]
MKRILFLFLICFSIQSCKTSTIQNELNSAAYLNSLYKNHQYFELRDKFEENSESLSEKDQLILSSKIYSVFNDRKKSNDAINKVFEKFKNDLTEPELIDLLEIKMMNSVFLYDYAEALKTSKLLLEIPSLSEEKRKDFSNVAIIYNELKNVPKQEKLLRKSEIPISIDLAGLSRIPATINKLQENVVFDTGANFSVITDSLAIKAGIPIGKNSFEVRAVTGNMVESHIGVADWLKVGNSLFKNVVFLVFPEESMNFPEVNYSINSILGFPVISAMEEIQL